MSTGPIYRDGLHRERFPESGTAVRRSPGPAVAEFDPLLGPSGPLESFAPVDASAEARILTEESVAARPTSLLVVDDSPDDLLLFGNALEQVGRSDLVVRQAMRADEALELIGRARPDLVVLDLGLPDRSGLDLLRDLKAGARTRSIPIVVFSGSTRLSDVARAYALGAASFVKKPDHPDEYAEVVGLFVQYWVRLARLR